MDPDPSKPTTTQPPAEPRSLSQRLTPPGAPPPALRNSAEALLGNADRPARLQMIAALVLGLVLVAIPLYLWRRPRSEAVTVQSEGADAALGVAADGGAQGGAPVLAPPSSAAAAAEAPVLLSDARVLECHDAGRTRTRPEDCDHLAAIEKSFAQAITASASCVPTSAGGGSLVYVADVSFLRKRHPIAITLPRDGRALKNAHASTAAASACAAAVKHVMSAVPLEGQPHAHGRYKIAITATYDVGGGATSTAR